MFLAQDVCYTETAELADDPSVECVTEEVITDDWVGGGGQERVEKAALMNHMVAHQNDRPHACNLCGVRYVRKCDLMNHLKVHAFVPDNADSVDFGNRFI
ncbi:Zinc finger protein [Operophtera brumata]|uniref:Zinc finger protein n=1 Tax=Operophtera brumata TaxID=104452 RepID=A0A0L7LCI6_OPEBR|nr:Zinc finger protein [Operophtera brumata]